MAASHGYGRNKNYSSSRSDGSDDDSLPPPKPGKHNDHKQPRRDLTDLENMTLDVVDEFKEIVRKKIRDDKQMSESTVESEVANIRRRKNPNQCNINQWKKDLPRDCQNCSDRILRESMAYGNDPHEVKSIIQSKMNNRNPMDDPLSGIIDPLKTLKTELDESGPPNLFRAVQKIDSRDIDRANRLFHSEAYHFAPRLKDYTFTDAKNAVQAIRETKYVSDDPQVLIPLVKTLQEVKDIRDYLEKESKKSKDRDVSPPTTPTRYPVDDHPTPSPPIISNPNRKNNNDDTSSFYYKPLNDPYSSPSPGPSMQTFDSRSRDETKRSPPPHRNVERK